MGRLAFVALLASLTFPVYAAEVAPAAPAEPPSGTYFGEAFVGGLFFLPQNASVSVPGFGSVSATAAPPPMFHFGVRGGGVIVRTSNAFSLEWLGTFGMGMAGSTQKVLGTTLSTGMLGFELLPSLRGRMAVMPKLSLTGELGIGLEIVRTSTLTTFVGETSATTTFGLFRLALGGRYELTDQLGVFFEPLGIHALIGQAGGTAFALTAGASYAF